MTFSAETGLRRRGMLTKLQAKKKWFEAYRITYSNTKHAKYQNKIAKKI